MVEQVVPLNEDMPSPLVAQDELAKSSSSSAPDGDKGRGEGGEDVDHVTELSESQVEGRGKPKLTIDTGDEGEDVGVVEAQR
jgi:hypothetical protein